MRISSRQKVRFDKDVEKFRVSFAGNSQLCSDDERCKVDAPLHDSFGTDLGHLLRQ